VNQAGQRLLIYDPSTTRPNPSGSGSIRDAFPNNRIPTSRFSGITRKLIPYAQPIKPNRPGLVPGTLAYIRENYVNSTGSIITPTDKGSAKIDHLIQKSHRMGFLYNVTRFRREFGPGGPAGLPIPLWNGTIQTFDTETYRGTYDWTISPRLLNHFSLGGNNFENYTLAKTFTLRESFRLDLRGEAFNLFNRTVFGTGPTNLDSNAFGLVSTQANTPRQMQLALKLYW
jgi:hypothetical protein